MGKRNLEKGTLVIIDMQNDFITGSLANPEAEKIIDPICELIKEWKGNIIATRDTHHYNYLETTEGKKLPVEHCIEETVGWCIEDRIMRALNRPRVDFVDKHDTFALDWSYIRDLNSNIYLVGTCTDICVISNALALKTAYPNKNIIVYENLCAGTTLEKHKAAIEVMMSCQIDIELYKPEIGIRTNKPLMKGE